LLRLIAAATAGALTGCAGSAVVVSGEGPPVFVPEVPGASFNIPRGHYPPPGSCRIWLPGVPPGQQSPPGDCEVLRYRVPPGAVLVEG
jgi:hypothetical protein